jgi:hypothetical protein
MPEEYQKFVEEYKQVLGKLESEEEPEKTSVLVMWQEPKQE